MSVATAIKPSLTIRRHLKASPAKVFAAWTDPQKIMRWMGPGGYSIPEAAADARVDGRFRIVMLSPEGTTHAVGGAYREYVLNEKLVFTWSWDAAPGDSPHESLVTVVLKPDGSGTLLTLTHERLFDETSRDGHEKGWIGSLDKLEKFVA
jgi:uncharacterized protein YndB with AHSA1/START domain